MKLVIAIVQDKNASKAVETLIAQGYRATRINTAGAFWRRSNATILTGVEDSAVHQVIQIFRETCSQPTVGESGVPGTGVVFVLPVGVALKF
jgi:uncharacterized protein YaaQ